MIKPKRFEDEGGFLAPSFSVREFEKLGLNGRFVENNISHNNRRGTLRGLHSQAAPYGQAKLVRGTRGSILDVAVDLRPSSHTFREWVGNTLSAENLLMMYLPGDLAHGFLSKITRMSFIKSRNSTALKLPEGRDGMTRHLASNGRYRISLLFLRAIHLIPTS